MPERRCVASRELSGCFCVGERLSGRGGAAGELAQSRPRGVEANPVFLRLRVFLAQTRFFFAQTRFFFAQTRFFFAQGGFFFA